jgi:hypothetical protein
LRLTKSLAVLGTVAESIPSNTWGPLSKFIQRNTLKKYQYSHI